jgi:hypothetical protein
MKLINTIKQSLSGNFAYDDADYLAWKNNLKNLKLKTFNDDKEALKSDFSAIWLDISKAYHKFINGKA